MTGLTPGFYLARVYGSKTYRQQFPWMFREYDGQSWWELGREGSFNFPACDKTHSRLIGPINEPAQPGKYLTMWENRAPGFYWFYWPQTHRQEGHWDIAEFIERKDAAHNGYWRWMGTDGAMTDNDMRDHPLVGPIQLPSI